MGRRLDTIGAAEPGRLEVEFREEVCRKHRGEERLGEVLGVGRLPRVPLDHRAAGGRKGAASHPQYSST